MAFFGSLFTYLFRTIVLATVAACGVFLGKYLRDKKN